MAKEMMNFNLPKEESSIIKVIGVGGGGSNAVNHMYKQGIRGVDFVVCNTDQQALDMSPVPKKIALGSSLTEGRGAGAQAEVGRNAAIENLDDIKEILGSDTKMVFITAGMGGGTGTGAAPVIAEAARELGILTVGIVTIPFGFEGKKRKLQAALGLEELKKHVDTVLIISNDKLREMYGNLKLSEAFGQADDVLSIAAKGIAEIITVEGYVNVDFEDVRTVMTKSGVAIMGSATTSGEDRAIKAVEQALASPLLNDNNIFGASNILLYISSGKDEVTMDEVAEITDYIQEEAGMDADVIWGNGTDEEMDDKLTLTIIATGFSGEKLEKVTGQENVIRHTLDTRPTRTETPVAKTEVKPSIPSGLTTRPVLMSERLNSTVKQPAADNFIPPTPQNTLYSQPIIKHSLVDDKPTKEEKPSIMAYKVEETDEETNAFIHEEAPEMTGIKPGEDFPFYEDEEEPGTELNELPTGERTSETTEEKTPAMEPFSLFRDTPAEEITNKFINEEKAPTIDENIITPETPTEVELKPELPTAEEKVKKFSLYDDEPTTSESTSSNDLTEEPKLITRSEPLENRVDNSIDMEEMHRKQQERMERLKNMNQRFRSPNNLAELENVPAFKRRHVNLDDTPHSSESSVTRFDVRDTDETDENGNKRGGLSDGNEFLHQSVD
jgi:cell division protein FtsZ